jgi:sigma-B regulation protein RsbU (phosphoserine phosphatase)
VSGALVMSAARSVFRMLGENNLSVSESMISANRRTKKDIKSGMFVALLYALVDAKNRTIDLCSAGQTQPIMLSAATHKAALVETEGDKFPLGILEDVKYQETKLALNSGDQIVFYTDGFVEAMNEKKEIFGFERLLTIIEESSALSAEALLNKIISQVREFCGSAEQHDDLTAIVLKAVEKNV